MTTHNPDMTTPTTYRSIKSDLLGRIRGGEWPPGARLPDEVVLAQHYGAARTTVGRAMRELVSEGLIERRRKAGTRVRSAPLREARFQIPVVGDEIAELGAEYRYALVQSRVVVPPDFVRGRMGMPETGVARHLLCMHYADGQPYQFEDRWISLDALPQARSQDFAATGPNEWLVRQIPFSDVEISLGAVDATAQQAQHLGCNEGDALFCTERQTRWEGRTLTFVRLVYRRGYRLTTRY